MSSVLQRLPTEIQQSIVNMLHDQSDLVRLSQVSRLFYELATKSLYSKIYLNDSCIEQSSVWKLAPTWSWLPLSEQSNDDEETEEANEKFKLLVRSLEENKKLCNKITQVRLNWDLDLELQREFIEILMENSQSLKILENITDPILSDTVSGHKYTHSLISLDLPPPDPIPSTEANPDYLPWLRKTLKYRLSSTDETGIKSLTVFMDPVLMFTNVFKMDRKFKVESIKIHCRADTYSSSLFLPPTSETKELKDVLDVDYLTELTMISWYDQYFSAKVFKFEQWREFKNLQDITMIAVTFEDKLISQILDNCYVLKRLKLDFAQPQREIGKDSLMYQSILKHLKTLEFLDIKLDITNRMVNLDLRNLKIVLNISCPCDTCQIKALHEIFHGKILPLQSDFTITTFPDYPRMDFFSYFFASTLSPYSKAVDRYPSVKTGPDDIDILLDRFNEENSNRPQFKPLETQDFYTLFHCLIHNMRPDMEPFVNSRNSNLKFLVVNDISFVIENLTDQGGHEIRYPKPLFYTEGFKTNFGGEYKPMTNTSAVDSLFLLN